MIKNALLYMKVSVCDSVLNKIIDLKFILNISRSSLN